MTPTKTNGSEITEEAVREHLKNRPVTILRIAKFLFNRYGGSIDLRDYATRPLADRIEHFLTRALAAHAVVAYSGADPETAALCVVDGGQDLGIDAIAFDEAQKRCWLVQSKFAQGGQGPIPWTDLAKFLSGFEALASESFEQANPKILAMSDEIRRAASEVAWKWKLVLATTSSNPLAENYLADIHSKLEYQDPGNSGTFTFDNFHLNEVTKSVENAISPAAIDLEITLEDWGCVTKPHVAYYGNLPLSEIIKWRVHGVPIFDKNLRVFDADSHVAKSITATLLSESKIFWYLNNGATLLCESIDRSGPYSLSESRAKGVFHCKGVSIVNGAQTIGTIWDRAGDGSLLDPNSRVQVRLISVQDAGEEFGARVTKATNTQKNILARDFATLDVAQRTLQKHFSLDGLIYVFRTGVPIPPQAKGCTFDEVSLSLACERSLEFAVIAYRNPGFLTDPENQYYKALFHGDRPVNAEDAWRAVRIYRHAVQTLANDRAALTGRKKQGATHGARYIVHRVFNDGRVKKLRGEWATQDALDTIAAVATEHMELVVRHLDQVSGYLQVLFKNTDRVRELDAALKNAPGPGAPPPVTQPESAPGQKDLFGPPETDPAPPA
jgi:hypothetical protein